MTNEVLCYLVVSKYEDDDMPLSEYFLADSANATFVHASKVHAFSDCGPNLEYCYVLEVHEDKTVKYTYAGWMPGMRYVWEDNQGNVVYDNCFPHWDH